MPRCGTPDGGGEALLRWTAPAGLLILLSLVSARWPALPRYAFAAPSARLAAAFLAAPVEPAPGGLVLHHPLMNLQVGAACSGFGFFALLCAIGLYVSLVRRPLPRLSIAFPAGLLAAYGVALFVNAVRLVCALYAQIAAEAFLTAPLARALHLAVGVAVFLPALIACHLFLQRRYAHAGSA